MVEPWLRGTLTEVEPVRRAVLHALVLAGEDAERWCAGLGEVEMFARPAGLPSVAFQMRHIVRSLDRLLTYAEGRALSEAQLEALRMEMDGVRRPTSQSRDMGHTPVVDGGALAAVREEFRVGLERAVERVLAVDPATFAEVRGVGRLGLPSTVVGLLVHCAEHTQRHVGQMVTTAKVVRAAGGG